MKNRGKVEGQYSDGSHRIQFSLSVYTWQQDGVFFVYSPTLDVVGYGNTQIEAENSFSVTLEEFNRYVTNKGTVYDELENLGWLVNRKKKKFTQPDFEDIKNDNEDFMDIIKSGIASRHERDVAIA
jgi:hypothetical protein